MRVSIILAVLSLLTTGCTSIRSSHDDAANDNGRNSAFAGKQKDKPLLVYRYSNNLNGRRNYGTSVEIGFLNNSHRIMKKVAFYLALYYDGVPIKHTLPLAKPIEVTANGVFIPGERYSFTALQWVKGPSSNDVNKCAKLVGLNITFEGGKTVHVDADHVSSYFLPDISSNCWKMHVPVPDASK